MIPKTRKNPNINAITSLVFPLKMECPTTIGINGNTHGEITDNNPAEKENKKPTSIKSPQSIFKSSPADTNPSCLLITFPFESIMIKVGKL